MIKKIIALLLLFPFLNPATIFAATYDPYAYQYLKPQNITGASDLTTKLESETAKIIASGHLAPFRALYGEGAGTTGQYYWYHNFDTIYTLSLIYPYVSSSTQNSIKTYLATEMQTYPAWSATYLSPTTGTKRQPDSLTTAEIGTLAGTGGYNSRPKLFALYALWLYAQNTGDWTYIQNNWTSIKSFYTTYRGETANFYSSIAGAIGYARMAHQKSPADTAAETQGLADVNTGMTNGKNFTTFGTNAENAFMFNTGENWSYSKGGSYMGFQFLEITPEIGKYISDDASLKSIVLSGDATYSLDQADYKFPLWYMAQGPSDTVYFGEGSGNPPDLRAMVFPVKAWVQKQPASTLRSYVDFPDALIGDDYYLQNLVRTVEASGTQCFEDITTPAQECPAPLFAAGNPTPSPSPIPSVLPTPIPSPSPLVTPTPAKVGDIDGNNKVDIFDYNILLTNFGKTGTSVQGDIDNSGKVDIFDYNLLLTNFGH